jgi:ubiquinol-cytochrome c reductase cytochrome b subunit
LVIDFLLLGWIGQQPVESPYEEIGLFATIFYFVFLLVLVPAIGFFESHIVSSSMDREPNSEKILDKIKNLPA